MISGFFSKYMINKIASNETPSLNKKRCINKMQKRIKCDTCIKCCPKNAIISENEIKINKEECNNCSICANVCPTGTMVPLLSVVEKQYNNISRLDNLSIGCSEEKDNADYNVECLMELPWDFLAYIALENKLTLSLRNCKSCKHENLRDEVYKNLEKLKVFLGEDKFNKNVYIIEDDSEIPIKEISRRDLLKMFGEESKRMMTAVIPVDFEKNKNGRIYRSILLKKISDIENKENKKETYTWCGLDVNDKCWGCGMCQRLCPNAAIKISENSEGIRVFEHNYTKCTHCNLCKTICVDKAITTVLRERNDINEKDKWEVLSLSCSVCKDPIQEDDKGMCIICKRENESRY